MIVRSMPNFSMDVYADGIVAGLKAVRPDWEIKEIKPIPVDRSSKSLSLRVQKAYERFWAFPRQVQKQAANFDIVHIVDHSEGHIVKGLQSSSSSVVVTCHDLINYYYPKNLQGAVRVPFLSDGLWKLSIRGLKQASYVFNVSDATAKDVNHILNIPFDRMSVVHNAVESVFRTIPEPEIAAFRNQLGAPKEACCLLNVGSDHPRKNIDAVLDVLAVLESKNIPVQLWKVGSDFTTKQANWIQQQDLSAHVKYLGNPDASTLIEIYNAANVLLAPSLHEGFGLTLLESLACGTPVITSNTSAMPEVVGDAGILVSPNDVEAMASHVIQLHTDTKYRQNLVEKGLDRVRKFTWEKTSEQIACVYEMLAA